MSSIVVTSSRKPSARPTIVGLVVVLTVVLLVACVCYMLNKPEGETTVQIKDPLPDKSLADEVVSSEANSQSHAKVDVNPAKSTDANVTEIVEPDTQQPQESVKAQTVKKPTPEEQGLPIVDLKNSEKMLKAYESRSEFIISGLANTKRGFPPPPIRQFPMHENVQEILDRAITIYDDEDPKVQLAKENCAILKQKLKDYMAEGGTAENFLLWYHNELSKDYNEWKTSQQYLVNLLNEGAVEEAKQFAEQANEELSKKGIREVVIPEVLLNRALKKQKELEGVQR